MGVLCQSCNFIKIDLEEERNNNNCTNRIPDLILPKKYVNTSNEEYISKEDTLKVFDNKESENKIKNKNSYNNMIEDNNIENNIYLKSRSMHDIQDNSKKKHYIKLILGEKKTLKNTETFKTENDKRSNSVPKTTKNSIYSNFQKLFSKKIKNYESKEEIINKSPIFKTTIKKSPTLIENSNILKQLFLYQMNIPIYQELLITKQKGNPYDKYIRGKKIGSGTYGVVYEAKNIIFNNKIAMKIIKKLDSMDIILINNEIDILKKLSHPNIVRIYEFYESKNNFYLINEYCDGGELFYYINKNALNEQQLSVLFYQVFSGLCYLHENNILHRDMKPENILISKKETDLLTNEEYFWIKIIDFGTAKIFQHDKNEKSIVGSVYYLAPEVLNKNYNEKCDTWSVGVIIYMFLTGSAPFDGKSNEEIINSIKTKIYDENDEKIKEYSPEIKNLIKGLLEKDINKRLSAKEALNHIWFKKFNGKKLFANFSENDIQPYINNLFNYTFHSQIQQLVIAFLVHNLPSSESSRNILKIYRYFNESGDCKLTKKELIKGLSKYRNEEEVIKKVDHLFMLLDSDKNGFIEFEEFLRACIDKKEVLTEEYLKYAFKFLDKENKGILTVEEINNAFFAKKNKLFEIAISKDINDIDIDGDGNINFEEFKILMSNTMN